MYHFKAPWSTSLIVISSLATVICLGVAYWYRHELTAMRIDTLRFWVAILLVAMPLGSALFVVRGYSITPDAVLVHRLLWATRLPRTDLQSTRFEPEALRRSIRIFGNGGFFSFTGWFRSPALGNYRAFATDPARAVVLRFTGRTVVVTPADPEAFVRALSETPSNA